MRRTSKSTLATAGAVSLLLILAMNAHCDDGSGRPFFVLAMICAGAGYILTALWMGEDTVSDARTRRMVLQRAREMVEEKGAINDYRLATELGLSQEEVSKWVDFGMNSGWLPLNPGEGMPAPEMGCLVVDLLGKPLSLPLFTQPVLFVDGNVRARGIGSFLVMLPEGPHRMMIMTQHRQKAAGGVRRTVTRETGTSVFVRSGEVTGMMVNPSWNLFGGAKITEYEKGPRKA